MNAALLRVQPHTEVGTRAERTDVLTNLVLRHGFTVGWELP